MRTVGGGTAKAAPRARAAAAAAASAPRPPAQSGLVQSGQRAARLRRGKGVGAFTWLCRDGSQAPGSASHLAISSPPPSSTQFGPPVP